MPLWKTNETILPDPAHKRTIHMIFCSPTHSFHTAYPSCDSRISNFREWTKKNLIFDWQILTLLQKNETLVCCSCSSLFWLPFFPFPMATSNTMHFVNPKRLGPATWSLSSVFFPWLFGSWPQPLRQRGPSWRPCLGCYAHGGHEPVFRSKNLTYMIAIQVKLWTMFVLYWCGLPYICAATC